MKEVTTAEAAERLNVSQQRVTQILRARKLSGRQLVDGTWLVSNDSIVEYQLLNNGHGRTWSAATSWALLSQLSNFDIAVAPRTQARIDNRIRTHSAEEIARKVASRTTTHRYAADSLASTAADLVLTGRSATDVIDSELAPQSQIVEGYLREGSLETFVHRHLLLADDNGDVTIYDHPKNVALGREHAPVAVIAADLARSMTTRERSAGLTALEELRQQWLAKNTK